VAIQNFLSGGFYGKLGEVVGQRWRNKRTVRKHVIPFNPRTEAQQSNRQQFALATSLAQQAFNINRGWDIWQRPDMGQFSFMVSVAKRRLQAGMSPAQALPLYPDHFDPNVVIRNGSFDWTQWSSNFRLQDTSYILPENRIFEVIINCYDMQLDQWVLEKYPVSLRQGDPFTIDVDTENKFVFPSGSTIQGLTIDDDQHNNISISLPVTSFQQPSKAIITIDLENWTYNTIDMPEFLYFDVRHQFPQDIDDGIATIRCRSIATGQMVNIQVDVHWNNPFQLIISFECEDYNFPAGSQIMPSNYFSRIHQWADFHIFISAFPFQIP
jgi:hypothetical protein